jgi:hypothetical protein
MMCVAIMLSELPSLTPATNPSHSRWRTGKRYPENKLINVIQNASFFLLATLLTAQVNAQTATDSLPMAVQKAARTVQPTNIEAHMRFLSDDKLKGRKPGTEGYEMAAQYVEQQLQKIGFKPMGQNGTYRQAVPLRRAQVREERSSLTFVRDGRDLPMTYGKQFVLSPNFGPAISDVSAPLVFMGYGIEAPELGQDDYKGANVRGKIVVCVNGAPAGFPSNERAYFSSAKAELAAAHGAVGLLTFSLPSDVGSRIMAASPRARQATYRWTNASRQAQRTFPSLRVVGSLSDSTARLLFDGAPVSFMDAITQTRKGAIAPVTLPLSAKAHTDTEQNDGLIGENVVAVLPGSDPKLKNEYVVYVSHLDHLGIGRPVKGDSIYNGAHDNASGTAINLETARLMASLPTAPRRSILFVGVTGEEMGLLGSDYFATNPTVPKDKIVANLTLDMPFFFHPLLDIVPYGAQHSTLGRSVSMAAKFIGVKIATDPIPEQAVFMRSDHFSFVRQGIPALFIKSGSTTGDNRDGTKLNLEWRATIYHSPQDDMNQPFDWTAAGRHAQLQFLIGYLTAQADARPTWNAGDFFGTKFGPAPASRP